MKHIRFALFVALAAALVPGDPATAAAEAPETGGSAGALGLLDSLAARVPSILGSVADLAGRAAALRGSRDERALREVERETVAMRRELGSFYLADGREDRAAEQFRNAVGNDPADTAAIFELANLRQRSGDWMEAMELYRVVYGYDPSYANVQGFHNALARAHADRLRLGGLGYVDSTLASAEASAAWSMGLSSSLDLRAGLVSREIKRYVDATFLVDDGMGGTTPVTETPSTQSLRDASMALLWSPPGGGLGVELELGATVFDRRASPGYAADAGDILSAFGGYDPWPRAALRTRFGSRGVSAQLDLGARLMEESLIPGRPLMYRGSAEGSLTLPFMDFSYARTYARMDGILVDRDFADLRGVATALQEIAFGLHLDDAPWTNLMLSAEASFEHAFRPEPWLYYAPDRVLNVRGAAAWMTWLGLSRGNVLGLSARLAGGLYADAGSAYPIVQADARVEWTRRDAVLSARAFGTQTFPRGGDGYWAFGLELSGSVPVPDLIAP